MRFAHFCIAAIVLLICDNIHGQLSAGSKDCHAEVGAFATCVSNSKQTQKWPLNRPYSDHANVNQCFSECGSVPDYTRSLFGDFLPIWQQASKKTWQEFLNTPEPVKRCMRSVVRQQTRRVLNACVAASGQNPLLSGFTEDLELPYCMLETPDEPQKAQMKIGMAEKVSILHQLTECKNLHGVQVVKKAIECIDGVQSTFVKSRFCPVSLACEKQTLSSECISYKNELFKLACLCARKRRDGLLRHIQEMYDAGSLQVLKLTPAFLGLDIMDDSNGSNMQRMKRCYAQAGLRPISLLTVQENPLLNLLRGFKPRPEGYQGILNLVYAQLDLPDVCDAC